VTRDTISLGSIAGIPVGTNPSLLFILLGGPWYLAVAVLRPLFPDMSGNTIIAIAVACTAGFLGSILAHELGHALTAEAHGVPVDGISIAWFGGAARLAGLSPSPEAEFRISAAGPAMNIALTVILGCGALLSQSVGWPEAITISLAMLAGANLVMLALFNLLPAAPFDGGRILTALLWKRSGDRARAMSIASWLGIGAGVLFCVFGWWSFVRTDHPVQLLYIGIGLFVLVNARAELQQVGARRRLREFTTASIMVPTPPMIRHGHTVAEALDATAHLDRHTFAVVDDTHQPTGIVSRAQLLSVAPWERSAAVVRQLQIPLADMPSAFPGDDLEGVAHRLFDSPTRVLAVGDGTGRVLGTVDLASVMAVLDGTHPATVSA
jgi:Zn-dependent protease